jgi:hypothetical protein
MTAVMAIPKTVAAGKGQWMEMALQGKECVVKRRPSGKKLLAIAEERSLSYGELMDGLQPVFPALSGFKAEGDNGRSACEKF